MAYESARRADQSAATAANGLTDDTLVTIVLAASAAEAFLNDMVGCIRFLSKMPGQPVGEAFNRLVAFGEAMNARLCYGAEAEVGRSRRT
jgi:hypothetical protein